MTPNFWKKNDVHGEGHGPRKYSQRTDDGDDDFERRFQSTLSELAATIRSKHINGQHRYITDVIVPDGHNGLRTCLEELYYLIKRYPPSHWYIVTG